MVISQKPRIKESVSQSEQIKCSTKDKTFLTKIHINSDHTHQALFYEPPK